VIVEELESLKDFIIRECTVNCAIGARDRAPDQLPMVEVVPDLDVPVYDTSNERLRFVHMPITIRILTGRTDEVGALIIFENVCRKLGQFNREKGHTMDKPFRGEYSDSQYTLTGALTLSFRIHDNT
jgi:hypothetical protein